MTSEDSAVDWGNVDGDGGDTATDYLRTVTGLEAIREYKRRTHELLAPDDGDRVLDVGCGLGDDVAILADHVGTEGEAVGIDRSRSLVANAGTRVGSAGTETGASTGTGGVSTATETETATEAKTAAETETATEAKTAAETETATGTRTPTFHVGDTQELPYRDDAFDACRADRVFQHLREPRTALAEMRRVTRPGGKITVSDPDWETLVVRAPDLDEEVSREVADRTWTSSRNPAIGRRHYGLFLDAGFDEVTVEAHAVVLLDFETANEVLSIEERLDRIVEVGVFPSARVEEWISGAREADDEGALFCSMTGYTVAGTVPET